MSLIPMQYCQLEGVFSGIVFRTQNMSAHLHNLVNQIHIVVVVVFLLRVQHVTAASIVSRGLNANLA